MRNGLNRVAWEATVLPLNYTRWPTQILCRIPTRSKLRPEPTGTVMVPQRSKVPEPRLEAVSVDLAHDLVKPPLCVPEGHASRLAVERYNRNNEE